MYYAVILAGGSGTRLWPLSRRHRPKQALTLVGDKSMFQHAVERIRPIFRVEHILVVTRNEHASILMEQAPDLLSDNFILEPEGRGTAPAIGLAAIHLQKRDPNATMAVLTADHFINNITQFCSILSWAEEVASDGSLVTLGIRPSFSSSGFGYIQHGDSRGEKGGFPFYKVQQFIEKPDFATAEKMIASGTSSWNSGMFIFRVDQILKEIECQMPDLYRTLMEIRNTLDQSNYQSMLKRKWPLVVKQTIDYGVMEAAHGAVVIPVDIGWTDVGSWGSLFDLLPADKRENVLVGDTLDMDTRRTLVFSGNRLVATLGVQDLIIIDTEDALLVCSRDHEQEVKALVEKLIDRRRERLL